jgi:hypothetical protein
MDVMRIILLILQFVIAAGALFGGIACIIDPTEPLGAPVSMLAGSIFSSFLIPGIILATVLGIGNLFGAIAVAKRFWAQGAIIGVLGLAMIIWIVVQVIVIKSIVFPHILFLCIGVAQTLIGYLLVSNVKDFVLHCKKSLSKVLRLPTGQ